MKLVKSKTKGSTVCKVYSDEKEFYGHVGMVSDLIADNVLRYSEHEGHVWAFISSARRISSKFAIKKEDVLIGIE